MATSDPFGVNPFASAPPAAPVLPQLQPMVQVRVGDDWPFQFNITDPTGKPIDLTGMVVNSPIGGATVGAELFGTLVANPAVIAGANGSLQIVDAVNGIVSGVVSRSLTALVPPLKPNAVTSPVCLSVFIVDTLWRKHTFPPIVLLPLRPQDVAAVPTQPQQITLIAGVQGPAGASSSLTADQIAALDAATLASAEAYTDQQIASLPDTAEIAQGLIRQALVAYALKSDVAGAVEAATAGFVTQADVQTAIQDFFNAQTFAPTGDALAAVIDARIVAYLQRTLLLYAQIPASATLSGSIYTSFDLRGSIPASASVSGTLVKQLDLAGTIRSGSAIAGLASISTPLSGSVPASASVTGTALIQAPGSLALAGSIPSSAGVIGSIRLDALLSGTIPANAGLSGTTRIDLTVSGSVPASASISGISSRSFALSGTASSLAIISATPSYTLVLNGALISGAAISGLVDRSLYVAGSLPMTGALTGTATTTPANRHPLFGFGLLGAAA